MALQKWVDGLLSTILNNLYPSNRTDALVLEGDEADITVVVTQAKMCACYSYTHKCTKSLACSHMYSLTHSLTQSLTRSDMYSLTHSLTHSLAHTIVF